MFWNLFKRPIQPYHKGFLPTKDGHDIFFQQFGNAAADNRKTILVFHGGPGGSSKYKHTLHYNLKKYRVILFDQRGCGQSICANALYQNTTNDLLDDANRLLNHLQITGKIIVGGGSWGSTLALLFAQKYPHRVSKLVLNSIFLANTSDLQWMPQTSRLFYPDFIDRFRKIAGTQDIGPFFAKLLLSKNKKDKDLALATYASYERVLGSVNPQLPTGPFKESDRAYPLIFFHYDSHNYFLKPDQLIKNAGKIAHIPTMIFHNRLDMSCPVQNAWDLHKVLPQSQLFIIPDYGHGSPMMFDEMKKELMSFLP